MATTFRETIQGFRVFGLRNADVEIAVMPELGAKIISLVNRLTGREWMWSPPQGPKLARLPTRAPFPESSLVGADECIPTIAPCWWRGLEMADHGEVWTESWDLDAGDFKQGTITTRLRMPISPLEIERSISLEARTVRLQYTLRNLSSEPFEYIWAFHPLMNIEKGDRIILPESCTQVRTEEATGCPLGVRGDLWRWPDPIEGIHLDRFNLGGENRAVKLFTEPLTVGYAAIQNERTKESLTFEFDAQQLNTLGIWMNLGGWSGYSHIALEPTSGAPDALDLAVQEWKRFGSLAPEAIGQWEFTMTVG